MRTARFFCVVTTLLFLCACQFAAAGLYLHYTFNDPDGSAISEGTDKPDATFQDWDLGAMTGSHVAAPGASALHFPGSRYFDAIDNTAPYGVWPASMYNEMSVVYWLRFEPLPDTVASYMGLLGDGNTSNNGTMFMNELQWYNNDPTQTKLHMTNGGAAGNHNAATLLDANTWYNIVWTSKNSGGSGTSKFYINGSPALTVSGLGELVAAGSGVLQRFGGMRSGGNFQNYFIGDLDELRVYDHTLSDSEVAAIYAAGAVVPEPAAFGIVGCLIAIYGLQRKGR